MAHAQQQRFIAIIKILLPAYFEGGNIVDFGSLDLNGNNRHYFDNPESYTGIDIGEGPNVDVICKAKDYYHPIPPDVCISTEMLEHDPEWQYSLFNMYQILRPNGLLLITCAAPGRKEHGTKRSNPHDSPLTVAHSDQWGNYYRNIGIETFMKQMRPGMFTTYQIGINAENHDLQFFGLKK